MKESEKRRLKYNWHYAKKLWLRKKEEHRLKGWSLKLRKIPNVAGYCSYMNKTITLSNLFMMGHNCDYSKVKKVLMHEIAHAVTPGQSHNEIWKNKCRKLGGDSRLAVTMVDLNLDWSLRCKKCGWRQDYSTKPNVVNKICIKCKRQPIVKYVK